MLRIGHRAAAGESLHVADSCRAHAARLRLFPAHVLGGTCLAAWAGFASEEDEPTRGGSMGDLKTTTQRPGGVNTGMTPEGDPGDGNRGADFGTSERATRGTDRDLD